MSPFVLKIAKHENLKIHNLKYLQFQAHTSPVRYDMSSLSLSCVNILLEPSEISTVLHTTQASLMPSLMNIAGFTIEWLQYNRLKECVWIAMQWIIKGETIRCHSRCFKQQAMFNKSSVYKVVAKLLQYELSSLYSNSWWLIESISELIQKDNETS